MYRLRKEFMEEFKQLRTNVYANMIGCDAGFISSILSSNKWCSEMVAKSIIGVKDNITIKEINTNELLEKYFIKEK